MPLTVSFDLSKYLHLKVIGTDATEICLFLATKYSSAEVVSKLLKNGTSINGTSLYGRSCLHLAAYHGRNEIIHHLLAAGIDSSLKDTFNKTAVQYARENEHFEAARWCWLGRWQYGSSGGIQITRDEPQTPKLLRRPEYEKTDRKSEKRSKRQMSGNEQKVKNWLQKSDEYQTSTQPEVKPEPQPEVQSDERKSILKLNREKSSDSNRAKGVNFVDVTTTERYTNARKSIFVPLPVPNGLADTNGTSLKSSSTINENLFSKTEIPSTPKDDQQVKPVILTRWHQAGYVLIILF